MRNAVLFILGIALWSCSTKPEGAQIAGSYENPQESELVKIELVKNNELTVVDSFYLDQSGSFDRSVVLTEPSFLRLNFYNKHIVNMVLTNEDNVQLVKTEDNLDQPYRITGSKHTDYIYEVSQLKKDFEGKVQQLNDKFLEARNSGDMSALEDIKSEFLTMQKINNDAIKQEIWKMDNSISGILSTSFLNEEEEFSFLDSLAQKYEKQLPNSSYTADLTQKVNSMRNLAIGAEAPEISLPNPNGEIITLSSLRGKYVLIDFWAAWCRPCRMENPNVVKMYEKYHDKGFDILGVSLDRKKESWVQAIQQDGLNWNHVSDLQYFNSEAAQLYQINSIPATYLIDPEGKIIGKNLRGPVLEAKLEEIFG
ncbi:peroxiredoxin family protein [Reichenbachiella ulvae]|uniref:TlpA family protein disulfide reductase n=1 Tax=Reichenbachiella ulvae TaxID=2980104 RepID=A0ABT3CRT0_9BACT|nr:TlpA disulfide reductase family protein [Reichenbachiella ulvae]MCV9386327.1 TlpA family protein disulfide reductase [Reichenbachiella ulvae]